MSVPQAPSGPTTSGTSPPPPDFVTFSKKMQAAGFYHNLDTTLDAVPQLQQHVMGDPTRTLQARQIIRTIQDHDLVQKTDKVGNYIYGKLSDMIENGAGRGKVEKLRVRTRVPSWRSMERRPR